MGTSVMDNAMSFTKILTLKRRHVSAFRHVLTIDRHGLKFFAFVLTTRVRSPSVQLTLVTVSDPFASARDHNKASIWFVLDRSKLEELIDIFLAFSFIFHHQITATPGMAYLATVDTFLGLERPRHA